MINKIKLVSLLSLLILIEIFLIGSQAYIPAFIFFLFVLIIVLSVRKAIKKFNKIKTILSEKEDVEEIIPISDNTLLVNFKNKEGVYVTQQINPKNLETINDLIIKKVIDYETTPENTITKLTKTSIGKDLKTKSETKYNWTFILENGQKILFPLPLPYKEHKELENFMLKYFRK